MASKRGYGSKPAVQLPHYKYIELSDGKWRTNEHSMYNLSSKTDDDDKNTVTNNIYILEISINTVFWQCIKKPEAIDQWPVGRWLHAGAIIITGSDCPMLVISGGLDKNDDTLDDCWIFNITQHSWIKLAVPHSVSKRSNHSLSVFIMSPHCVWMITAGGGVDKMRILVTNPNIVMITELVTNSKGEWTVGDTLDTNGMNNEEYKKKYQQQLQTVRRIWLEEYQQPRKGDTANIEQTVQALMKSLEEKERETQVYHQLLEQKEREEAEKGQEIRRCRHQLQEKDRDHKVKMYALSGDFIGEFGENGSGPEQFAYPRGIACDNEGYLFIADYSNTRILILTMEGKAVSSINCRTKPVDVAVSVNGSIHAALDYSNVSVYTRSDGGE
ncbi:PREDICTED: uncharacterized protein LOC109583509 [Amphimedon queenslandica]|uniref:Bulb-type lectin domain-containing protein n=2 Tax=Amphimedon queenslandica TaxID=400682 RepID=A0AAN0JCI6_AMPQE|nr:PREDICTED: uncharacterized protein LOC109583509 [Amphimedon queenslandica]|eukprot:XP_019854456.1 PREDICTED: uncharacterized protein LOC109583509 [Amphimedon queenslandica]